MKKLTYSRRLSHEAEDFFAKAIKNWPILSNLWNFKSTKPILSQVEGLSDVRGRMGLKGSFEVDTLHKWAPVIIVKPSHLLHSSKVLEQTPFLNAVHDSLIRYEVDFISQNTTLPILFITNDKDQCKAALQEGIEALHIKKPTYAPAIDRKAVENLDIERIRSLILSLLCHSSVLRMTSQAGEYYLSWTWWGRSMDDISEHKIRLVDSQGNVQFLFP